jgi:hypothetical protein
VTRTTRPPKPDKPQVPCAHRYAERSTADLGAMTFDERRRHHLHRDLEAILDAEPMARLDKRSVGMPSTYRARDGSPGTDEGALNGVEAASQQRHAAVEFLAAAAETIAHLIVTGRSARSGWPQPLAEGTKVSQDGRAVVVGARAAQSEECGLCGELVTGGAADPIRRIDGAAYHAKTCWFTVHRQRRAKTA